VDEVIGKGTSKEFFTLEFGTSENAEHKLEGSCLNFLRGKVTGDLAAEVLNATETLNFPVNGFVGTGLDWPGAFQMEWTNSLKQALVGGGTLEGA
jgi:hypothetical protein